MKEYINRELALKTKVPHYSANGVEIVESEAIPVEYIENLPATDVVELKHGEWIFGVTMHHEWMKCSVCNVSQDPNGCFSYCPNCGAKMDGGADK